MWQSIQDDISNEKLLAHVQTVMAGNEKYTKDIAIGVTAPT